MSAPELFSERRTLHPAAASGELEAFGSARDRARIEYEDSRRTVRANRRSPSPPRTALAPRALCDGARRSNESALKRALDICGALAGIILLSPFLLALAIIIRLDSRGSAIFAQRRTGRGGVTFRIYKFRTMTVTEDGPDVVQAAPCDARVTKLGAFLRRSSIDELPQLINVLKGEMSLVGPRPHAIAHDEYYGAVVADYDSRFLVRPGIAGLAQVSGYRGATRTVDQMAGRVALDRLYIANWSFAGDVRILAKAMLDGPFHPSAF